MLLKFARLFAIAMLLAATQYAAAAQVPTDLTAQVNTLPETTSADKLKKTTLSVAIERARLSLDAGNATYANAMIRDVKGALAMPAVTMAKPVEDLPFISSLAPVKVTQGNPYIDGMVQGVKTDLKRPDLEFVKATSTVGSFSKLPPFYSVRNIGAQMESLLWLFANPSSPLKNDPAILRLFLRRSLAYVDQLQVQCTTGKVEAGQGILDDFAIAPASVALREFAQRYPGLLLPSQRKQWDEGMNNAGVAMFGKADGRKGIYANIDVTLAFELANFGLYFHNPKWLAQAKFLVDVQKKNIYPDGAISYILSQNDSPGYHGVVAAYLMRYQKLMGDTSSRELLLAMEPYRRLMGKMPDWWTAPSWKQGWYAGGSVPSNELPKIPADNRRWEVARMNIEGYTGQVDYQPLPDNFTVLDRNVLGPRAWYGDWNYVATLRPIPSTEPGLSTLMGAQMADPDLHPNAAVMGVFPRVSFPNSQTGKPEWAFLTSDLKSALSLGRNWSALSASYDMATYDSSRKGIVVPDWQGRQIWLGLPDRIIGWLAVAPTKAGAAAGETGVVLRLGTGGHIASSNKSLQTLAPNSFEFGQLKINVLGHNFSELTSVEVPAFIGKANATELTFRSEKPEFGYAIIEVRPMSSVGEATAKLLSSPDGLTGLRVEVGAKRFTIWANFGRTAVTCDLTPNPAFAGFISLHRSQSPTESTVGYTITPATKIPATVTLAVGEQVVLVESQDAADHLKGWTNFPEMLAQSKK